MRAYMNTMSHTTRMQTATDHTRLHAEPLPSSSASSSVTMHPHETPPMYGGCLGLRRRRVHASFHVAAPNHHRRLLTPNVSCSRAGAASKRITPVRCWSSRQAPDPRSPLARLLQTACSQDAPHLPPPFFPFKRGAERSDHPLCFVNSPPLCPSFRRMLVLPMCTRPCGYQDHR